MTGQSERQRHKQERGGQDKLLYKELKNVKGEGNIPSYTRSKSQVEKLENFQNDVANVFTGARALNERWIRCVGAVSIC